MYSEEMNRMKKKTKVGLACTDCGSRNYSKYKSAKLQTKRLEIKKYCSRCDEHTIHKETR